MLASLLPLNTSKVFPVTSNLGQSSLRVIWEGREDAAHMVTPTHVR